MTINKIAEAVSQDLALSSGLFQTINSPYYGLANHISSIQQAAVLPGLRAVKKHCESSAFKSAIWESPKKRPF